MAPFGGPDEQRLYDVHRRWLTDVLPNGGSLLTPGAAIWTAGCLAELVEHFSSNPDTTSGKGFFEKLADQLAPVSDEARQLMAELLVIHFLMIHNSAIGSATKRAGVEKVLALMDDPPQIPADIVTTFAPGISHPGQFALSHRDVQIGWLIAFATAAVSDPDQLSSAVDDPWAMREMVNAIGTKSAEQARLAMLHMSHPATFEAIVSPAHKQRIADRFADHAPSEPDVDRRLLAIRKKMSGELGDGFDWYSDPMKHRWIDHGKQWAAFVQWCGRLRAVPDFEQEERTYKLKMTSALMTARKCLVEQAEGWPEALKRALGQGNLLAIMTKTKLWDWLATDPESVRAAFAHLSDTTASPGDRIDAFVATLPDTELPTLGERVNVASVWLFGEDPEGLPPMMVSAFRRAERLAGWGLEPDGSTAREFYERALAFCDELSRALPALDDRLDAQSVIWMLVKYKERPTSWSDADWAALEAFRDTVPATDSEPSEPTDEAPTAHEAVVHDEHTRRRLRYLSAREAWMADDAAQARHSEHLAAAPGWRTAAVDVLAELAGAPELSSFAARMAKDPGLPSRLQRGAHRNFAAHLAKLADPSITAAARSAYQPPADPVGAAARLTALEDACEANPARVRTITGLVPLAVSAFWALEDPARWPPQFGSIETMLDRLGWLGSSTNAGSRYLAYRDVLASLDDDLVEVHAVLDWLAQGGVAGIDPTATERCAHNEQLAKAFFDNQRAYPDQTSRTAAEANAKCLIGDLRLLAIALDEEVEAALGRKVTAAPGRLRYGPDLPFRHEAFVAWQLEGQGGQPTLRAWVTSSGVLIGLHPGARSPEGFAAAADRIRSVVARDLEILVLRNEGGHLFFDPVQGQVTGEFLVGRGIPLREAVTPAVASAIVDIASAVAPLIGLLDPANPTAPAPDDTSVDALNVSGLDHMEAAAADLLVDLPYLEGIEQLLEDKGQAILYGPPGTGKTFVAKRLARALAEDDPARWAIVQFHPATTYEDFIEGLRPRVTDIGQVTYHRVAGPLVRLADMAAANPGAIHVLVIDEINRANLPKVLGEMLFLLEYRDESVQPLYREGGTFTLPKNLWFIGTMNTADRSVALIDAAMRRRFHFVPFFPDHGPMAGLLARWLREHKRPERIAEFVRAVNADLRELLGEHLLLGPSFFMKEDLSEAGLARIWEHNVFPFLEEQFWGDREQVDAWRWNQVRVRYAPELSGGAGIAPDTHLDLSDEVDAPAGATAP